jgi:phosphoketolase
VLLKYPKVGVLPAPERFYAHTVQRLFSMFPHVRGYKELGNINTPLELAIQNQTDRFSLAIDAIDRMPRFRVKGASVSEAFLNQQIACKEYAHEFGIDQPRSATGNGLFRSDLMVQIFRQLRTQRGLAQ